MNQAIALEALLQRGRTPLYLDLVSLYRETQDALRELKKASPAKYNIQLKLLDYPKKLKAIVKHHTGLNLITVTVVESRSVNAYATIDMQKNLIDRITKGRQYLPNVLDKINNVYDDRKAKVEDDKVIPSDIGFHFGIFVGFWRMRNSDGSFHFTPEELAAVTLHEIGHFDHWIRTLSKPILKVLDASDIITYVKSDPDRKIILTILDKLKVSKSLDKSWSAVLKVTDLYFRSNVTYSDPQLTEALTCLETLIVAEVSSASLAHVNTLSLFLEHPQHSTPNTKLYGVDAERSADEFAARNGAYSELASSLVKITDLSDTNSLMTVNQFVWVFPGVIFSTLMKLSSLLQVSMEDIAFGYDPIVRRLELVAQTAKHALSDSELPIEIKSDILEQIKTTEMYIQKRAKSPYRTFRKKIKDWKDAVGKYGRVVISPIHDRTMVDYQRLQDASRNLGRHSLYYLSEK